MNAPAPQFSTASKLPPSQPSPLSHLRYRNSAKRKFESLLHEKRPLFPAPDVRIDRHSKGSGSAFSEQVDLSDDNANFEEFHLPQRSPSGDVPVSGTRIEHFDRLEDVEFNVWLQKFHLQSRNPFVGIANFPGSDADPKHGLRTEWQGLHEHESSYCIESGRALRVKKAGSKQNLDHSTKRPSVSQESSSSGDHEIAALREALRDEKEALRCLQVELEEERNASTTAANEAMAMIARLQEEKAAVLMEARQFKRMAEERETHNQEAIALLKEMLLEREEETAFLENELAACRQMFLNIEAEQSGKGFNHVRFLEEGDVLPEKEAESSSFLESLKSWTSSHCESRQFAANSFARDNSKEEVMKAEFAMKRKTFNDLHADSVRNNLVRIFDQVGGAQEASHAWDTIRERLKCRNASEGTLDESEAGIYSIRERTGCKEAYLTEEICDDLLLKQSLESSSGPENEAKTPHFFGKHIPSDKVEAAGCVREESTLSLWERIMKLEQRLDTFGMKEPCQDNGVDSDAIISTDVASYESKACFASSKQETRPSRRVPIPEEAHFSLEKVIGVTDCSDKPLKKHCKVKTTCLISSPESQERKCYYNFGGDSVRHCSTTLEQPCHQNVSDMGEGVHDIYEVQLNHISQVACLKPLVNTSNSNMEDQNGKEPGKPDSHDPNSEISDLKECQAVITEAGGNQGALVTGGTKIQARTPQGTSDGVHSLSVEDAQQLNFRLQALEAERIFMTEAIDSLKKENRELKLLQDIAQQLCDLKRTVHTSEQSKEQPSFISFLKGLLSFVPCGVHSQGSSLALPFQESVHFSALQRDHVGLCHLLEKSAHTRKFALVRRVLKVRIPIAGQEADCI